MHRIQKNIANIPSYPVVTADGTWEMKRTFSKDSISVRTKYIVKPFSINILKASIANLLANRALLRKKYADLEINAAEEEPPTATCSNSLDWIFMSNVKKNIEDNIDNPDFTVDTLCSLLNMSRTSFYNKLKALTPRPGRFVRNIRLKHGDQFTIKEGKYYYYRSRRKEPVSAMGNTSGKSLRNISMSAPANMRKETLPVPQKERENSSA